MVGSWPQMFKDTCTNGTCTALRHAWRRDDNSGTTDTFVALLGLPKPTERTFCNGFETEDLDPVRTPCDANEDVCAPIPYANRNTNPNGNAPITTTVDGERVGQVATPPSVRGGDLGLVQAITLPTDSQSQFSDQPCTFGKFAMAAMLPAGALEAQRCPDGLARLGNRCKAPFRGTEPPSSSWGGGLFGCIATINTLPSPRAWTNMDGRAYNLIPRDPKSGMPLLTGTHIGDPRWAGGGVYRIHQIHKMANAAVTATTCTKNNAADQIGCLIGADPCSIGFSGQELLAQPTVKGLKLRTPAFTAPQQEVGASIGDTAALVKLLDTCPSVGTRYALARRLYINSSKGLGNVDNGDPSRGTGLLDELKFLQCVSNRSNGILDNAIMANRFITMPVSFAQYPTQTCQ